MSTETELASAAERWARAGGSDVEFSAAIIKAIDARIASALGDMQTAQHASLNDQYQAGRRAALEEAVQCLEDEGLHTAAGFVRALARK